MRLSDEDEKNEFCQKSEVFARQFIAAARMSTSVTNFASKSIKTKPIETKLVRHSESFSIQFSSCPMLSHHD